MLHQRMMFRYGSPDLRLPEPGGEIDSGPEETTSRIHAGIRLAASVCGNVLVGAALIGGLLVAPQFLARLLGLA